MPVVAIAAVSAIATFVAASWRTRQLARQLSASPQRYRFAVEPQIPPLVLAALMGNLAIILGLIWSTLGAPTGWQALAMAGGLGMAAGALALMMITPVAPARGR